MNNIVEAAINSVQSSSKSFCKFISANDAGTTGAHQSGFYIPKNSISLFFENLGVKGENKDKLIKIKWFGYKETDSRIIYYGVGSRNEYRLTRFGKGFPFLTDDNVGDLIIISLAGGDEYEAFVLQSDEDIENFFAAFNISANETNKLIEKVEQVNPEDKLNQCFNEFNKLFYNSFPSTSVMSSTARECYNTSFKITDNIVKANPDSILLKWLDSEYKLFKLIELAVYSETIKTPFNTVEELINIANTILNRRKSRAGKSLEFHLAETFNVFNLKYTSQAITEDNKKPDFIFPSDNDYDNINYDNNKLVFLAAKTTCKDRWRQIINEANKIKIKHLFTLQQGISKNQLKEMYNEGVRLVVPKYYLQSFPKDFHDKIYTLEAFINLIRFKQNETNLSSKDLLN